MSAGMTGFYLIREDYIQRYRFLPWFEKTKGSDDFVTALLIPSQHDSPEGFTKHDALLCLCHERLSHLGDVATGHRFSVCKSS